MDGCALQFDNVTLGYDRHPAVHHLDYSVSRGQLLAVVGPNGAGKSTLLKGIMGTLTPFGGAIRLHQIHRNQVAYLPQQTAIDPSFPISVFDMVAMGLWQRIGAFGSVGTAEQARITEALTIVGLHDFPHRPICTLSGGQLRRTLFARLLLQDAALILLDEPFTSIDVATVRDLMGLVRRWHSEARTVIAVLHDLEQVRTYFPETLLLAREAVAVGPSHQVLTPANLKKAYSLTEAFDDGAHACVP